eukprot:gene12567-8612_t
MLQRPPCAQFFVLSAPRLSFGLKKEAEIIVMEMIFISIIIIIIIIIIIFVVVVGGGAFCCCSLIRVGWLRKRKTTKHKGTRRGQRHTCSQDYSTPKPTDSSRNENMKKKNVFRVEMKRNQKDNQQCELEGDQHKYYQVCADVTSVGPAVFPVSVVPVDSSIISSIGNELWVWLLEGASDLKIPALPLHAYISSYAVSLIWFCFLFLQAPPLLCKGFFYTFIRFFFFLLHVRLVALQPPKALPSAGEGTHHHRSEQHEEEREAVASAPTHIDRPSMAVSTSHGGAANGRMATHPPDARADRRPGAPSDASPPASPPASPAHTNTIRPSQFTRAVDLINAVVSNERTQSALEADRSRAAGWVHIWVRKPNAAATYSGAGEAQTMAFVMQPVWLLTDGDSLIVVDFNGTNEHRNYKESMHTYLTQLGSETERGRRGAAAAKGNESGAASQDCTVVYLSVDFASDFQTSGSLPLAPAMLGSMTLRYRNGCFTVGGNTKALDAAHFDFARSRALVLLLRGERLVQDVLEEMCNAFLPPFLEEPYDHGVLLEGRWCTPQEPPGGPSRPSTGSHDGPSTAVPHPYRLWRPIGTTAQEIATASQASTWHRLFPAVEAARWLSPLAVVNDLRHAIAAFPRYKTIRDTTTPSRSPNPTSTSAAPDGRRSPPPLGAPPSAAATVGSSSSRLSAAADASARDTSPAAVAPGSRMTGPAAFAGRGHRLGGRLDETAARRRAGREPGTQSAPRFGGAAHAARYGERQKHPQGGVECVGGGDGGPRGKDLAYVSPLEATGPKLRVTWTAYQESLEAYQTDSHNNSSTSPRSKPIPPALCKSVTVLTPFGRIELERTLPPPPPPTPAGSAAPTPTTTALDTAMVTVKDCKDSLVRSAMGRAQRLRANNIHFTFGPGIPELEDTAAHHETAEPLSATNALFASSIPLLNHSNARLHPPISRRWFPQHVYNSSPPPTNEDLYMHRYSPNLKPRPSADTGAGPPATKPAAACTFSPPHPLLPPSLYIFSYLTFFNLRHDWRPADLFRLLFLPSLSLSLPLATPHGPAMLRRSPRCAERSRQLKDALLRNNKKTVENIKELKARFGDAKLSDATVSAAYGGMRGVTAMVYEPSLLDPLKGIRFRGLTIPECQERLPKAPNGEEPLPEGMLWLLMTGEVPTAKQVQALTTHLHEREDAEAIAAAQRAIAALPKGAHPMTSFGVGVLALQTFSKFHKAYSTGVANRNTYWEYALEDTLDCMARTPAVCAMIYNSLRTGKVEVAAPSNPELDWAANFTQMMGFKDPEVMECMRLYLSIHVDHEGGNVSAHATTLVGSALSDPYLSFCAGLHGLAGPLHGLANQEVLVWLNNMMDKCKREKVDLHDEPALLAAIEKFAWEILDSGNVVPGFGHAVLRVTDPRYDCQRAFCLRHFPDDDLFRLVGAVYKVMPDVLTKHGKTKNPFPNVDAHSGVLLQHYGITEQHYYTVLFGLSRQIGVLSSLVTDRLQGRPLERPKSTTTEVLVERFLKGGNGFLFFLLSLLFFLYTKTLSGINCLSANGPSYRLLLAPAVLRRRATIPIPFPFHSSRKRLLSFTYSLHSGEGRRATQRLSVRLSSPSLETPAEAHSGAAPPPPPLSGSGFNASPCPKTASPILTSPHPHRRASPTPFCPAPRCEWRILLCCAQRWIRRDQSAKFRPHIRLTRTAPLAGPPATKPAAACTFSPPHPLLPPSLYIFSYLTFFNLRHDWRPADLFRLLFLPSLSLSLPLATPHGPAMLRRSPVVLNALGKSAPIVCELKDALLRNNKKTVENIKELKARFGDAKLSDATVSAAYGGMRGVTAMVYEPSLLDPLKGIRFRGLTIPECQERLPKAPNGEEPLPEGMLWLLMTGEVPTAKQVQALTTHLHEREDAEAIAAAQRAIAALPKGAHPMTSFGVGVLALQTFSKFHKAYSTGVANRNTYWEYALEDTLDCMARTPAVCAMIYNSLRTGKVEVAAPSNPELDWAANFTQMMGFKDPEVMECMRLYLSIHVDHEGGNVSAHATTLVGSALSDPYLSFCAGLHGLAGPLHGLANQEVLVWLNNMMDKCKREKVDLHDEPALLAAIEKFAWEILDSGNVVPGFGHAVLRVTDPRYDCQRAFCLRHFPDDDLFRLVGAVYKVMPDVLTKHGKTKNPFPNVDAHSGVLLQHYGITEQHYYTVLFGLSRQIGVLSSLVTDRLQGRPLERPKSTTTEVLVERFLKGGNTREERFPFLSFFFSLLFFLYTKTLSGINCLSANGPSYRLLLAPAVLRRRATIPIPFPFHSSRKRLLSFTYSLHSGEGRRATQRLSVRLSSPSLETPAEAHSGAAPPPLSGSGFNASPCPKTASPILTSPHPLPHTFLPRSALRVAHSPVLCAALDPPRSKREVPPHIRLTRTAPLAGPPATKPAAACTFSPPHPLLPPSLYIFSYLTFFNLRHDWRPADLFRLLFLPSLSLSLPLATPHGPAMLRRSPVVLNALGKSAPIVCELKDALLRNNKKTVENIKELKARFGDAKLSDATVSAAYGGMRGVTAMVYEPSLLDPLKGIRFRGLTIPECQERLPKAPNGEEPLPEGMLWLLMTGEVPTAKQVQALTTHLHEREDAEAIAAAQRAIAALPKGAHPMTSFGVGVLALQTFSKFHKAYSTGVANRNTYWEYALEDTLDCMARTPAVCAMIYNSLRTGKVEVAAPSNPELDWAANFTQMMGFKDPEVMECMRLYLSIHVDHEGGNVSAHATTLVGSALSDPYLSFCAGLHGLAGPLHGLANQEVLVWLNNMMDKCKREKVDLHDEPALLAAIEKFAWEILDSGNVVPGFGHAVLRVTDPRYDCQRAFCLRHFPDDDLFRLVGAVYKVMPDVLTKHGKTKNPFPNVDAHSGVLLQHYGITEQHYYTVLFGLSRQIGVLSSLVTDRLQGRPLERPKSTTTEVLLTARLTGCYLPQRCSGGGRPSRSRSPSIPPENDYLALPTPFTVVRDAAPHNGCLCDYLVRRWKHRQRHTAEPLPFVWERFQRIAVPKDCLPHSDVPSSTQASLPHTFLPRSALRVAHSPVLCAALDPPRSKREVPPPYTTHTNSATRGSPISINSSFFFLLMLLLYFFTTTSLSSYAGSLFTLIRATPQPETSTFCRHRRRGPPATKPAAACTFSPPHPLLPPSLYIFSYLTFFNLRHDWRPADLFRLLFLPSLSLYLPLATPHGPAMLRKSRVVLNALGKSAPIVCELKDALLRNNKKTVENIKELKARFGDAKLSDATVSAAYGGMRGVTAMVYEPSLLDPLKGIRFRGLTIPECQERLPKAPNGEEPLPEGMLWLLMTGEVPTAKQVQALTTHLHEREDAEAIAAAQRAIAALPKGAHPMTSFGVGVLALQTFSKFHKAYSTGVANRNTYWEYALEDTLDCMARTPAVCAMIYNSLRTGKVEVAAPSNPELDWAANFTQMMGFKDPEVMECMRLYLSIHVDHEGGNVSAHATTLVGSALSDPYLSFCAGLHGLAGPLHGLANQEVLVWLNNMMDKCKREKVDLHDEPALLAAIEKFAWEILDSGNVVPGFGHAVLRVTDPRYDCQRAFCLRHFPDDDLFRLVGAVYKVMPDVLTKHGKTKNPFPNVDAHSGVLLQHYGITEQHYYTVLFGLSRQIGVLSSLVTDRLQGRPLERPKSTTTEVLVERFLKGGKAVSFSFFSSFSLLFFLYTKTLSGINCLSANGPSYRLLLAPAVLRRRATIPIPFPFHSSRKRLLSFTYSLHSGEGRRATQRLSVRLSSPSLETPAEAHSGAAPPPPLSGSGFNASPCPKTASPILTSPHPLPHTFLPRSALRVAHSPVLCAALDPPRSKREVPPPYTTHTNSATRGSPISINSSFFFLLMLLLYFFTTTSLSSYAGSLFTLIRATPQPETSTFCRHRRRGPPATKPAAACTFSPPHPLLPPSLYIFSYLTFFNLRHDWRPADLFRLLFLPSLSLSLPLATPHGPAMLRRSPVVLNALGKSAPIVCELKDALLRNNKKTVENIKELKARFGDAKLSDATVSAAYGGMRGVTAMGIRFRGLTIPECQERLPKAPNGEEPLPEGMLWLLMTGEVPTAKQVQALTTHLHEREDAEAIAAAQRAIAALPKGTFSKFHKAYSTGVANRNTYWEYALEDTLDCMARTPAVCAMIYNSLRTGKVEVAAPSNPELDWAANFTQMMGFKDPEVMECMRLYLSIHVDHEGGNVSAHATTLVGSALSDPYLSFCAGLHGLAGPLHGLANQEVLVWLNNMMDKCKREKVDLHDEPALLAAIEKFAWEILDSGNVVPGFGHAVLRVTDPRYDCQRAFCLRHFPDDDLFRLVGAVYKVMPDVLTKHGKTKNPFPNVDAHSGVLLQHYGITEQHYYTVLFGLSRQIGVLSSLVTDRLQGRPLERPKSTTTEVLVERFLKGGKAVSFSFFFLLFLRCFSYTQKHFLGLIASQLTARLTGCYLPQRCSGGGRPSRSRSPSIPPENDYLALPTPFTAVRDAAPHNGCLCDYLVRRWKHRQRHTAEPLPFVWERFQRIAVPKDCLPHSDVPSSTQASLPHTFLPRSALRVAHSPVLCAALHPPRSKREVPSPYTTHTNSATRDCFFFLLFRSLATPHGPAMLRRSPVVLNALGKSAPIVCELKDALLRNNKKTVENIKELKARFGDAKLSDATVSAAYGGMRGVTAMVYEPSLLDPLKGIRFRGLTIPECQERLPKGAKGSWFVARRGTV